MAENHGPDIVVGFINEYGEESHLVYGSTIHKTQGDAEHSAAITLAGPSRQRLKLAAIRPCVVVVDRSPQKVLTITVDAARAIAREPLASVKIAPPSEDEDAAIEREIRAAEQEAQTAPKKRKRNG